MHEERNGRPGRRYDDMTQQNQSPVVMGEQKIFEWGGKVYLYEKNKDRLWGEYWKFVGSHAIDAPTPAPAQSVVMVRYSLHTVPATGTPKMLERKDGDWVEFTDAQAAIAAKDEEIERALGASERFSNAWRDAERRAEAAEARVAQLEEALARIAEGNLGDHPWQANYDRVRQVAFGALHPEKEGE